MSQDRTPGSVLLSGICVSIVNFFADADHVFGSECQKRHYRFRKRLCGKLLSENTNLPLHNDFAISRLNPFLQRQIVALTQDDIATWTLLWKDDMLFVGHNFLSTRLQRSQIDA